MTPQRVPVFDTEYTVMECPDPLDGGGDFQLDHADRVIWIAPGLHPEDRWCVLPLAVAECWREYAESREAA